MKKTHSCLLLVLFLVVLIAGCLKQRNLTATIVRDCTGTYLRIDGKDYHVCNPDKVSAFAGGAQVSATFRKLADCTGPAKDSVVCKMLHLNEGWIEVAKIK